MPSPDRSRQPPPSPPPPRFAAHTLFLRGPCSRPARRPIPAARPPAAQVAKPMSVRERLVAAAGFYQRIRVTQNPGRNLDYWQEAFVVVVAHLADEMLARAVILGGLGLWFRDRLVEADFEFAQAAALGPWAALGALLVFEVARKQRALLNRVQVGAAKVEQDKARARGPQAAPRSARHVPPRRRPPRPPDCSSPPRRR